MPFYIYKKYVYTLIFEHEISLQILRPFVLVFSHLKILRELTAPSGELASEPEHCAGNEPDDSNGNTGTDDEIHVQIASPEPLVRTDYDLILEIETIETCVQ